MFGSAFYVLGRMLMMLLIADWMLLNLERTLMIRDRSFFDYFDCWYEYCAFGQRFSLLG